MPKAKDFAQPQSRSNKLLKKLGSLQMKDSNREAFESWATDKFPIAGLGQFEKHNNGTYFQRSIRNMYEVW